MSLAGEQANLSNWRSQPYSRWSFRNISEFLAVAGIANASDVVRPLQARPRSLDGFRLALESGPALGLEDFLLATATDAFVVLHDGSVVHEFYDHGNDAHTPHILMSASKSVTGLIAGILEARGELETGALVSHYLPEISRTAYRGATLRHLLDMRAGIALDERQSRVYALATNWEPALPHETPIGLRGFFAGLDGPQCDHDGPFKYVSANTDLLGWVIERATGKTFASLVSELLWRPMGAEHAAFIAVDREGAPRCTGGVCATARDFGRLGQLMVDGGRSGSTEIIPPALIEDIAGNGDPDAWKNGEFSASFGGRRMSYRSGWYVVHDEPQILFAMGIHGQNLFVDRINRLVIAKLSSQDSPIDYRATALTHRAVAELRRCLAGT